MTRMGFFTDTSICIGCKACEVACKEWDDVPDDGLNFLAMSYDNTGALGADTWRHVAFVEKTADAGVKWLMSSDVCKHCTHAACLDVCPTGALFRTEFDTVVVQQDVCNGCGYCVPACPFGVIDKREADGRVWKCTLCYDRLKADMTPACAQACPTESIQFGPLDELRVRAQKRVEALRAQGNTDAYLYGAESVGDYGPLNAFFLLQDHPNAYNLPEAPPQPLRGQGKRYAASLLTGLALTALSALFFRGGGNAHGR